MQKCDIGAFSVLANDSDPDGNPITVIGVGYPGSLGNASFTSTQVTFQSAHTAGTANVTYTIQDSAGATASAVLSIAISGPCVDSGQ
jgi:hypothetical protein